MGLMAVPSRSLLLALALLALVGCSSGRSGGGGGGGGGGIGIGDLVDYPTIVAATAGCAPDDWWDMWAEVSHPDGSQAVTEVTVDISYVFYDTLDDSMILEYLGGYYLDYQADGQWAAAVESGTDILDCYYEGEYHFLFGAADQEGETAAFEVFN